MFAIINLPGSSHHKFFYGSKKECRNWLNQQEENADYLQDYYPSKIISDKEAFKVKFLDGNRVYYFQDHSTGNWYPRVKENGGNF